MTFKDLVFKEVDHLGVGGKHATCEFKNGYGASIVAGEYVYRDDEHPYELAVLLHGAIDYKTPLTDDVIGHLNAKQVTGLLKKIEALPKPKVKKGEK